MLSLLERDRKAIWHPFTQHFLNEPPLPILSAKGAVLYAEDGKSYIDAISSWWVNLHGHANEHIASKISAQLRVLEQVIFAGCTHPTAVELAELLLQLAGAPFNKVFYSDDGSTAVEVALKMAMQHLLFAGKSKPRLIALEHSYHGDTFGAMSLGARGAFNTSFERFMFEVHYLDIYQNQSAVEQRLNELLEHADGAVFIYEPLLQGAGGMKMYSAELLERLLKIAKEHKAVCIADEVLTGFMRSGKMFASHYLQTQADLMCLSKGISGGFLPLGATLCTEEIYQSFLSSDKSKMFMHGHSYTANPLACSAAIASIELLKQAECSKAVESIANSHREFMRRIQGLKQVQEVRMLGSILAVEIKQAEIGYFSPLRDALNAFFLKEGVLLRPLGNVVYVLPPYCITKEQLDSVYSAIEKAIQCIT